MTFDPAEFSIAQLSERLERGDLSSESLVAACLERIGARDGTVKAWEFLDADTALAAARQCDLEERRSPMHGIPVGIKDIIDTKDYPTEYGTPIYRGRQPSADAACVSLLKQAGAVILGKTRTTELAALHPTVTTNPHNPAHTPGGSSSGSAAAVGDLMVPAALGTQTFGSVIRPAAYCGVVGYKPTYGTVTRAGLKPQAESFDTIGTFTRSAADLPLILGGLTAHPPADFEQTAPTGPRIGVCRGPAWDEAAAETVRAIDDAAASFERAGATIGEIEVPQLFEDALDVHFAQARYEMVRGYAYEWREHREKISKTLTPMLAFGETVTLAEYRAAKEIADRARAHAARLFQDFDALLTASQPGEAPKGLDSTGNPVLNRLWTLLHLPCVTLPFAAGPNGLPVGVQLVGPRDGDSGLIAIARWAEAALGPIG